MGCYFHGYVMVCKTLSQLTDVGLPFAGFEEVNSHVVETVYEGALCKERGADLLELRIAPRNWPENRDCRPATSR